MVGVVLLIVIPEATSILLGESWLPIVPVFRLMTVYVVLDPLYLNLSRLVIGVGRPRILVRVRLGQVLLFVAAVVVFSRWWSIEGIAIAANLMMLAGVVALLVYSARYVRMQLARMLGWPTCALLVAAALGVALSAKVTWPGLWPALIVKMLGVSLSFALVLVVAERRTLLEHGGWLRQAIGGRAGREVES
jgi:O-antigen/teichoic acid export membrane protein